MVQARHFDSPTPRSFLSVFSIVSRAVSQSISPPLPAAGGLFDSVPGLAEDGSGNESPLSFESDVSLSRVCAGGFQGGGIGMGPPRGADGRGAAGPGPGWAPLPA